jgi:hypothetical protein
MDGETAADTRCLTVSRGDTLPDMHLRPPPAHTRSEAGAMVAKIIGYEQETTNHSWA